MRKQFLWIALAISFSFNQAFASKVGEHVAGALLFIPGMILEEYFASAFDEGGAVDPANTVFVPYVKASGLHPDYEAYIIQTFTQYVKDAGRYKLTAADKNNRNLKTASVSYTNKIAKDKGCRYALYINITKRRNGMLFAFAMKDTDSNKLLWDDEYLALIPEDVAPILYRVAATMGTGRHGSNSKSFYDDETVTFIDRENFQEIQDAMREAEREQAEENEKKAIGGRARIGFTLLGDLLFHDLHPMAGFGFRAWYDTKITLIEGAFDFRGCVTSDTSITMIGANLLFPILHTGNHTPYLGLGGAISITNVNEESNSGFSGSLETGYLFNRQKPIFFRVGLRYFRNFYKTNDHKKQGLGLEVTTGF